MPVELERVDATKTLGMGLRILRALEFAGGPVSAQDLSRRLEIPRSTIYRFLKTLVQQGFAMQTSQGYLAGPYVTQASRSAEENWLRSSECRERLASIAEEMEETTVLTVIRWPSALALAAVEGPRAVRWSFTAGTRHPLYAGASAKVLLAFLSDEALNDYSHLSPLLALNNGESVQSWAELRQQLDEIRVQQFCISHGEVDEGVAAVAVPIFSHGHILASVSVVGPAFRFDPRFHSSVLQNRVMEMESYFQKSQL